MTQKQYGNLVNEMSPRSPVGKDCIWAFCIGGLICVLGQLFSSGYQAMGIAKEDAGTAASMTLVALSALLTGIGIYDDIA